MSEERQEQHEDVGQGDALAGYVPWSIPDQDEGHDICWEGLVPPEYARLAARKQQPSRPRRRRRA